MRLYDELYKKIKKYYEDKGLQCPFKGRQKNVTTKVLQEHYNKILDREMMFSDINYDPFDFINITLDIEKNFGYENIPITEGTISDIKNLISKFSRTIQLPPGDLLIQVGVSNKSNDEKSAISTKFSGDNLDILVGELFKKIETRMEEYDHAWAPEVTIYANEFFIRYKEVSFIRRSRVSETNANERWLILDSNTEENCLFVSTIVCKNWKQNKQFIVDHNYRLTRARRLKEISRIHYVSKDTLYEYAIEQQINIIAYNNIYEKINYKGQDLLEEYPQVEMQFVDNWKHVKPMIRRKFLEEIYPDINIEKIININDNSLSQSKRRYIKKSKTSEYRDKSFATWDLETFVNDEDQAEPYLCGFFMPIIGLKQWWGKDCINCFLEFLNTSIMISITLYAHNGGKFDIKCIFNDILSKKYLHIKKDPIYQNGSMTMLEIITENNIKIVFKDSYRLFSSSLKDICKGFNVETQKGEFDHTRIKGYSCIENNEILLKEVLLYNEYDCKGLFECVDIFSKFIFNKYKINITKSLSASTLAKNIFTTHYVKNNEICLLTKEEDVKIRKGYYGGRTECFKIGLFEDIKLYYYDFTSLYPYVGSLNYLPIGEPFIVNNISLEDILKDTKYVYFVDCYVKSPKFDHVPVIGIKYGEKYVFPIFEDYYLIESLYSVELRLAINVGYDIKISSCIKFKRGDPLRNFYTDIFYYKKNAENKSIKNMWKIIINAGYGFFGLKLSDKQSLKISDISLSEYKKYLLDNKLVNYKKEFEYELLLIEDDIKSNVVNVSIASAITSLARCVLYEKIRNIKIIGGEIYYCDTDSIITNLYLENYGFKIGSELGFLKNELEDQHIISMMISGPKAYWYLTNMNIELSKLKGCSGSYDEKKEIIAIMIYKYFNDKNVIKYIKNRIEPIYKQISITSSLSMLLRDNSRCNPVIKMIDKIYSINYTKGKIKGNDIIPLRITLRT